MYHMHKWRFLLPATQGCIAAALLLWQIHNSRIIASMGMAWDTGAPIWPFQTPEILLVILNAPAYLLAAPVSASFGLQTSVERAPVMLPAIVLLWFYVGRSIDFGLIPRRWLNRKRLLLSVLIPIALSCILVGIHLTVEGAKWWSRYGRASLSSLLMLARLVGPLPWCALVATMAIRVVIRTVRPTVSQNF
jgi:hypothetical protein